MSTKITKYFSSPTPQKKNMLRGSGLSPCVLSAGDCAAVSQFIPGADLQEVMDTP